MFSFSHFAVNFISPLCYFPLNVFSEVRFVRPLTSGLESGVEASNPACDLLDS